MPMEQTKLKCINGAWLKAIAMACMLLDHAYWTVMPGFQWMTCVGRLAFPVFAFLVTEGYCHTRNFKRYLLRMFLFALVSEIPFNLINGGRLLNPVHQNVMFTFCLALILLRVVDKAWNKHIALGIVAALLGGLIGYLVGMITFVDYNGAGVLTVLGFWLAGKLPRFGWAAQLVALSWINLELLGGLNYIVTIGGNEIWVPQQAFALLALIPIWLYNGQRGPGGKKWQYTAYAFYPVHILMLSLLAMAGVSL